MKKARLILTTSMFALLGLSAITFSSCTKDDKECKVGYEGSDCKTLSRDKFIGQWEGHEECSIGTDDYTIKIEASSSSEIKLVYNNVYNQDFTATGTMTGTNGFSFSGTASGGVTFSGNATYEAGTGRLVVDYTVLTSGVETNSCTFTGTKL